MSSLGRSLDLPCRICVFFDPFGAGLPPVEIEGQEPHYLDPNSVAFSWGFAVERDSVGNSRPPFFAPAPAAGRSTLFDAEGTKAFFEKVWRDHGRDGRVVGVLEGGKVVVASGELLLVVPSWCVVLEESSAVEGESSAVNKQRDAEEEAQEDAEAEGEVGEPGELLSISVSTSEAYTFTCPKPRCAAPPGAPCLGPMGLPRPAPHPARLRIALVKKREERGAEIFARELNVHVMNEGRKAASHGLPRSENPHDLSSPQEAARRTAWDAGWIYVAGHERLAAAVEEGRRTLTAGPVDSVAAYSIERHGPEGQYALYFGRGPGSHGLNLCALSDFDQGNRGAAARIMICDALNGNYVEDGPYSLKRTGGGRWALFRDRPVKDRLCTMWDFDKDGEQTRSKLREAMNRKIQPVDPLSVSCPIPVCGALAGEPCKKIAGDKGPRTEPHPKRVSAAEAARKASLPRTRS